jgi:hypothetical protein
VLDSRSDDYLRSPYTPAPNPLTRYHLSFQFDQARGTMGGMFPLLFYDEIRMDSNLLPVYKQLVTLPNPRG